MTEAQKTTIEIQELYWKRDNVQNPVQSTVLVVEQSAVLLAAEHFALTPTGLRVIGEPTYEQWESFGTSLQQINGIMQLAIGDWLNYGEAHYGETYTQAVKRTGINDVRRLANYKWVASRVPLSLRNDNLSYTTCYHAARVEDRITRKNLLSTAASAGWDSTDMKEAVDEINGVIPPALADYLSRAIAPLQRAAEAYPGSRRKLNNIIKALEAML